MSTLELSLSNLSRVYQDAERKLVVIDRLSFTFPAGKSVAIVGRSGVGKSTLLHLLAGLDIPSEGEVWYGDTNIASLSADQLARFRGEKIGFIFQFHHLLPEFDAVENVAMPLLIRGDSEQSAYARAEELLARVGLSQRRSHRPGELSGGEQQRVAVARALVANPAVILADEPTGNLDPERAEQVRSVLCGLAAEHGSTLIIVTHNAELAAKLDCVLEMLPGGGLVQRR